MRKGVLFLVLALLVCGSLLWAGGQSEVKKLVRFQTQEVDPASLQRFAEAEKRFEAANPKLNVQVEPVPTMDDQRKAMLAMAAGIQPGCTTVDTSVVPIYADQGWLEPIDDLMKSIGEDWWAANSTITHSDGHYYWAPYAADTPFVWARKDLMDAKGLSVPTTWTEWLRNAQALTEGKTYGMALPLGRSHAGEYFTIPFIWSAGSTLCDKDLKVTVDTEATRKAFRFTKDMAKYCPPAITEWSYGELIQAFVSEQCAMSLYAGRMLARMISGNPSLVARSIVFPYPKDMIKTTFMDWNSFCVFAKSGAEAESKQWLKFLLTDEQFVVDFLLSAPGHLIPPQKGMLQNPKFANAPVIKDNRRLIDVLFASPEYGIQFFFESGAIQNGQIVKGNRGTYNPIIGAMWPDATISKFLQQYIIENKDLDTVVKDFQKYLEGFAAKLLKK